MGPTTLQASSRPRRPGRFAVLRRLSPGGKASLVIFLLFCVPLIVPQLLAPYDPTAISYSEIFQGPSGRHWLGTDQYGRDILSRLIHGTRVSMSLGLVSVSLSLALSLPLGIAAGFYRGRFETVVMRLLDVLMAFPGILLALIVVAILGPGLANAMVAVGIGEAPAYTRVIRSAVLTIRENLYVESARAVGAGEGRTLWRHVLPNVLQPIIVISTVGFAVAIIIGSSLGFLGLGAQPPTAEWGTMVSEGRTYLRSRWWISTFPGATIGVAVIALNVLGDALRDVLDPRLRH